MKLKKIHKEISFTEENEKEKSIKKSYNIVKIYINNEITTEITFSETDVSYNTPTIIIFKNIQFIIYIKDFFDKMQVAWNCINKRRTKNKPPDLKCFCNGAIVGSRNLFSIKYFNYYLKAAHFKSCLELEEQLVHYIKWEDKEKKTTEIEIKKKEKEENKETYLKNKEIEAHKNKLDQER